MLREVWESVLGCEGWRSVERVFGKCGKKCEVCWSFPCLPHISFHLPYTPTHFPTPPPTLPHTPPSPLTFPTPQHTFPHLPQCFTTPPISPYLSHTPTHFPTPLSTSPFTYPTPQHTSQHPPHSILTPYTIPHFKKIMLKCFYSRFKPEKYVGTIVPMPPVKSVKEKKSNMPATCKHV